MHIELYSSRISVSESSEAYVTRRLSFALGRFVDVIDSVVVRLEDINGPRGGIDKLCRIKVKIIGQKKPLIVEIVDLEIRAAIDMAADRIGRAVARNIGRRSDRRSSVQLGMDWPGVESLEVMA
jgi:putative sigma-54 modulation protein